MSSRHLVDPELVPALDMLPQLQLSKESLPEFRTAMEDAARQMAVGMVPPPGIERREVFVPGPAGAPQVRLLVYTHAAGGPPRPAFYHTHGGGYVLGSPEMMDERNRMFAAELGCVVASVDYRLAPETAFPGNVEDCYAGLEWFHDNAASLGADPSRIAIGGESAGGGMAAATALVTRDRGRVPLILQLLVYPMLDDRSFADDHPYTGEFGSTRERNRFGWAALLGHEPGGEGVSPYASPARASSLEGLPPTFIGVGALDLFVEESVDYARRLGRAGVPVELHVYPGAFHGSDLMVEARLTKMHGRDQLQALRAAFQRSS